jgi:Peptidase inhibitor family I36
VKDRKKALLSVTAVAVFAGVSMLMAVIPAAAAPAAGLTAARARSAAVVARQAAAIPDGAWDNCTDGFFCEFQSTNGNNRGVFASTFDPPLDFSLWIGDSLLGMESFSNRSGYITRLYYGDDQTGAWVCVPNDYSNNDPNEIKFNNGVGFHGYGQKIFDNVESGQIGTGKCSNGL